MCGFVLKLSLYEVEIFAWLGRVDLIQNSEVHILRASLEETREAGVRSACYAAAISGVFTSFAKLVEWYSIQDLGLQDWIDIFTAAVRYGHCDFVRNLLAMRGLHVAEIAEAALTAHAYGQSEVLKILTEYETGLDELRDNGFNILHYLGAKFSSVHLPTLVETLQFFIRLNISVSSRDKMENTVLHHVCLDTQKCHTELISMLLEEGAKPLATNRCGWLPIHLASRRGQLPVLGTFLKQSGERAFLTTSKRNMTALHWAMQRSFNSVPEDFLVLELLLRHGLLLTAATSGGETPLSIALNNPFMFGIMSLVFFRLDDINNISGSTLNLLHTYNVSQNLYEFRNLADHTWYAQDCRSEAAFKSAITPEHEILYMYMILPRAWSRALEHRVRLWIDADDNRDAPSDRFVHRILAFLLAVRKESSTPTRIQVLTESVRKLLLIAPEFTGNQNSLASNDLLSTIKEMMCEYAELSSGQDTVLALQSQLGIFEGHILDRKGTISDRLTDMSNNSTYIPLEETRHLAVLYFNSNRAADAEPLKARVVDIYRAATDTDQSPLAEALYDLATTKQALGKGNKALLLFKEAIGIYDNQKGLSAGAKRQQIECLGSLAIILAEGDQVAEAVLTMARLIGNHVQCVAESPSSQVLFFLIH